MRVSPIGIRCSGRERCSSPARSSTARTTTPSTVRRGSARRRGPNHLGHLLRDSNLPRRLSTNPEPAAQPAKTTAHRRCGEGPLRQALLLGAQEPRQNVVDARTTLPGRGPGEVGLGDGKANTRPVVDQSGFGRGSRTVRGRSKGCTASAARQKNALDLAPRAGLRLRVCTR